MQKTYHASQQANGVTYGATLTERDGHCSEHVVRYSGEFFGNEVIHEADFPAENLGEASRDVYARTMLASVIYADTKAAKEVKQ